MAFQPEDMSSEIARLELVVYINKDGRETLDYQWSEPHPTMMAGLGYIEAAKIVMSISHLDAFNGDEDSDFDDGDFPPTAG